MKDLQLWALMNAGGSTSVQQVEMNDEGQLKTDAELTAAGITVDTDLDSINGVTIAQGDVLSAGHLRVYHVADAMVSVRVDSSSASVAATIVDSTGVGYSGSNPVPVGGTSLELMDDWDNAASDGVSVSGDVADDVADAGEPVKIGGIARTANRTAATATRRVAATYDDLGRQLSRPIQVRDLIVTAYAELTTGTETTLLAGTASAFNDLIAIMGANNSDAAVTVELRASTGGTVTMNLRIPANATAGIVLPVPYPQPINAQTWTADLPDITGTTVALSALFSQEV